MNDMMEIEGLYRIIPLNSLRKTAAVDFDYVPLDLIGRIDSIDRVRHGSRAYSPGTIGNIERPWYMHTHQVDHLIVMHGVRTVDLFSAEHGTVSTLEVTPEEIRMGDQVLYAGSALLSWPTGVFHRIISGDQGSNSMNFASHLDGFDIRTNFNIYSLNTETAEYLTIREGHLDQ